MRRMKSLNRKTVATELVTREIDLLNRLAVDSRKQARLCEGRGSDLDLVYDTKADAYTFAASSLASTLGLASFVYSHTPTAK